MAERARAVLLRGGDPPVPPRLPVRLAPRRWQVPRHSESRTAVLSVRHDLRRRRQGGHLRAAGSLRPRTGAVAELVRRAWWLLPAAVLTAASSPAALVRGGCLSGR